MSPLHEWLNQSPPPADGWRSACHMRYVAIVGVLFLGCDQSNSNKMPNPSIEYRGQYFRMSQDFADYENYTDSVDPIDAGEHERVSDAVRSATVPRTVSNVQGLVRAIDDVKFPGFQSGTLAPKDKSLIGKYFAMHAMIPYTDYSRFFIYQQRDDHLELIHQAELETFPNVFHFTVTDTQIVYHRSDGRTHEFSRSEGMAEP